VSAAVRGTVRAKNTVVGLLTLPLLLTSAVTGAAVFAVLSGAVAGVGPVALVAVHAYSGLVGLPLVLAKSVTGASSWFSRIDSRRAYRATAGDVSAALLVVAVVALYASGTMLYLNLTPGGASLYKTIHLWSALTAAPLLTHHLVRHLRRARLGAWHTLRNADPTAAHGVRRRLLLVGGAGTAAWAVARLLGRMGETAASSGPNDFPVTITAGGSDQPDPYSWRLEVDGDVARPRTFTLAELRGVGMERHRYSLDCILGWSVVREWGGVPVADLLEQCAPTGTLLSAVFRSTTGYEAALLAEQLADRRSMVALEVDGVPLAPEHGFPARVMAPGVVGEKCVKWIHRLTVVCT
jgi:DMSO/TMAO reductase YedYZ molybdopterin-dependent catalytic subunit